MTITVLDALKAVILIALGLAIGAMGIYVGEVDDAPGAGGMGLLLMAAGVVLGVKAAHRDRRRAGGGCLRGAADARRDGSRAAVRTSSGGAVGGRRGAAAGVWRHRRARP